MCSDDVSNAIPKTTTLPLVPSWVSTSSANSDTLGPQRICIQNATNPGLPNISQLLPSFYVVSTASPSKLMLPFPTLLLPPTSILLSTTKRYLSSQAGNFVAVLAGHIGKDLVVALSSTASAPTSTHSLRRGFSSRLPQHLQR